MDKKQEFILKINSNGFEDFVISANNYIDNDFVNENFDSMINCFKSFMKNYDLFRILENPYYNLFPKISFDCLVNIIYNIKITKEDREECPHILSKNKLLKQILTYKNISLKDLDDIIKVKNKLNKLGKNNFSIIFSNIILRENELNNIPYLFNKYINLININTFILQLYIKSYTTIELIIKSFNTFENFYNHIKIYCKDDYITTLVNIFYKKGLIEDSFIQNHNSDINFNKIIYLGYISHIYYVNVDFIYNFIEYIPLNNLKLILKKNVLYDGEIKNKKLQFFIEHYINKNN